MADASGEPIAQRGITEDGFLTDGWYLAATSDELKPGHQTRRMILGEPVMLARTAAGDVMAIRDICPHRLVALSQGRQVNTDGEPTIECPYHGWRFGADGVCKHIPSLTGDEPYEPSKFGVRSYRVHEANGGIFIYVAHDAQSNDAPALPPPDFGDLPGNPKFIVRRDFQAHMDDAVTGLIDPGHVPYVHSQWWWRPPSAGYKIKEKAFEPSPFGWTMSKHKPTSSSFFYKMVYGDEVTSEIVFLMPGFRWERVSNDKAQLVSLSCMTPIGPKETQVVQMTWFEGTPLLSAALPLLRAAGRKFLQQDGDIVALQTEGMEFQTNMLWLDDVDTQAKWYRTSKRAWAHWRTHGGDYDNPVEARTLRWRS
ncbi:MAG: aromatic ring-hydroxylating dioxygenase subunit alpha [Pseudomonadota bacterium]